MNEIYVDECIYMNVEETAYYFSISTTRNQPSCSNILNYVIICIHRPNTHSIYFKTHFGLFQYYINTVSSMSSMDTPLSWPTMYKCSQTDSSGKRMSCCGHRPMPFLIRSMSPVVRISCTQIQNVTQIR